MQPCSFSAFWFQMCQLFVTLLALFIPMQLFAKQAATKSVERPVVARTATFVSDAAKELKSNHFAQFLNDDMLLTKDQVVAMRRNFSPRTGVRSLHYRWEKGIVPYTLDVKFSPGDILVIDKAMSHIEARTCIRFKAVPNYAGTKLRIEHKSYCASFVGHQGNDQLLALSRSCLQMGTVVHELLHTLGFYHQQGAPDRDNYIVIVPENIEPGRHNQFEKYSPAFINDFGVPYDYDSVMHYSSYAFSMSGKPTIIPIEAGVQIGQRNGMSAGDYIKVNRMYNCKDYY